MYAVVVGMGQVGRHVVAVMASEGHDVVAVDKDPTALSHVEEHHDVATMLGYGASPRVLRQTGAGEADLIVAVTDEDEVNLVAALAGSQLGARRSIARLQGSEFTEGDEGIYQGMLGIDVVVNPQILVAQEIAKVARSHGALAVLGLAENRMELVQMELSSHSRILHKPLARLGFSDPVLVAAVVRDGDLFVPGGADVLLPGDRTYLVGYAGRMDRVEETFCGGRQASRLCLVGGGVVGEAVARVISATDTEVLLIEQNRARAEELAVSLPKVTVLHGDGTDLTLLEEEQVGGYELFCALTHDDEVNLMSALLASRSGSARTLCLVQRSDYMEIYRQLGVDVVLSPREVASAHILRHARQAELQSLTLLEGGQAELLEFSVGPQSRVVNVPLKRLNFPRGAIIVAIADEDGAHVPGGDDIIRPGSTVVALAAAGVRASVERLFQKRIL